MNMSIFSRRAIMGVAAWLSPMASSVLAGCAAQMSAAQPLTMPRQANAAEYARYMEKGTGAINGQAFLTTRGGDVKLGAGREVTLDPATPYAAEWFRQSGGDLRHFDDAPQDSLFLKARKTATVDAQGNFHFAGLAPGRYILRSIVTWEVPGPTVTQGGVVADLVSVGDSSPATVILNHVVSGSRGGAEWVELIPAGTAIGQKYTMLKRVSGRACGSILIHPSEADARDDLKGQAAKVRADAVINVVCGELGSNWQSCGHHIECVGDAIQWLMS